MDKEQITALAREYAADCIEPYGFSKATYEELVDEKAEDAACILRWLSNRFGLVEKAKIKEAWDGIDVYLSIALNLKYNSSMAERCASEKRSMLRSLFPEIAKEVES